MRSAHGSGIQQAAIPRSRPISQIDPSLCQCVAWIALIYTFIFRLLPNVEGHDTPSKLQFLFLEMIHTWQRPRKIIR